MTVIYQSQNPDRKFERLRDHFAANAYYTHRGHLLHVGQSLAVKNSMFLSDLFRKRAPWSIETPLLDGESAGDILKNAPHDIAYTKPAESMSATKREIIDYLAKRSVFLMRA